MRRLIAIALSSAVVLHVAPLMAAPAAGLSRGGAAALTGIISGTARNATGQTLADYRVQVRDLQTGRLAGTGTSNSEGAFTFAGLPPASYVVEIVRQAGQIVGSDAAMPVVAGTTVRMTVSATAATATAAAPSAGGNRTAAAVTTAAVAAGIAGVAEDDRPHASPSR